MNAHVPECTHLFLQILDDDCTGKCGEACRNKDAVPYRAKGWEGWCDACRHWR